MLLTRVLKVYANNTIPGLLKWLRKMSLNTGWVLDA